MNQRQAKIAALENILELLERVRSLDSFDYCDTNSEDSDFVRTAKERKKITAEVDLFIKGLTKRYLNLLNPK